MRSEGGELVGENGEGGVVAEGGGVSLGRERRWWLGERAQWQGGDGMSPRPACRILASGLNRQFPVAATRRRPARNPFTVVAVKGPEDGLLGCSPSPPPETGISSVYVSKHVDVSVRDDS